MKIVNVKTSVIELIFYHRDSENIEKNREGVFYLDKRLGKNKNKYKQIRSVRKTEIGRESFSHKLRIT